MGYDFLKKEVFDLRTQETFIGKKCEIFIPEYFFNKSNPAVAMARDLGEKIETIGLFWFIVDGKYYELQLPLRFKFEFSEVRKEKRKIKSELPEDTYFIYTLKTGDAFIYDILHKQDLDDFKKDFIDKLIEGAKLPNTIGYDEAFSIFLRAMVSTKLDSLGVSSVSLEILLSELFRNKNNLREPFRRVATGKNNYNYRMVNVKKVPELNSTFTSLIGENLSTQIASSILRNREGIEEVETPVEKIIKY